jgi:hypothetical protein
MHISEQNTENNHQSTPVNCRFPVSFSFQRNAADIEACWL